MSAYDNDPRVTVAGDGYEVAVDGGPFTVLHTEVFGWTVCHGPNLDYVQDGQGGFAIGYATDDDAIYAVAGDPR